MAQESADGNSAQRMTSWPGRLRVMRWLWMPTLAFVITRAGIVLVAYLAMPLIVDSNVPPYHIRPDSVVLDVLGSRWDSGFYLDIAEEGYRYQGVQLPSVAFFPLLPIMIRSLRVLTGDPLVAGLVVTNTALLAAVIILYRFVEDEWGDAIADRTVWYLLIFPASFFGSAIYSESLFLLGAVGAWYAARKGRWRIAALLGLLTALTRFMGIILIPALLIEWVLQRRQRMSPTRPAWMALTAPIAVLAGTGLYLLYLQLTFNDPLAFVHASEAWGRVPRSPLITIGEMLSSPSEGWGAAILAGHLPLDNWLDLITSLLFASLAGALLIRRRWGEGIFVMLGVLLPLSSGLLMSQRRYMWVLFPAFTVLARWGEHRWIDRTITAVSLMGLGLFTALFANWYWVG